MNDQSKGFFLVLLASVCLSTVPTVIKLGLNTGADALQLLAPRMILGAALLWLWVGTTRPHRVRIDRPGLRDAAIAGALNAVSLWLFYLGLRRIDVAVAILVFSVYPAILLLLLHLRGESATRRDVLRLGLAIAGIALVAEPGSSVDPVGILLILGCATTYSCYMLVVHTRLVRHAASTTTLWIVSFLALGVMISWPFADPGQPLGLPGIGVVIWSGVVGTAVARLATVEGIRRLGGGQTALLMPIETVMSVSWAALLLGERITSLQAAGAGLVLASVLLATVFRPARAEGS